MTGIAKAREAVLYSTPDPCLCLQWQSERHHADLRRALLDVDRERSAAAKLAKDLELARNAADAQAEQHRVRTGELQQKLAVTEGALVEARSSAEALRSQIEKLLVAKVPRKSTAQKRLQQSNS